MSGRLTAMNINERTLSPSTYQGDTRESLNNYMLVDTETGTIIGQASTVVLLHKDHADGDAMDFMSEGEVAELASRCGIPLDDEYNDDSRAFKAVFMDAEGEENILLGYFDGPLAAFRFLQQFPMLGRVDWGFDGDCWYTDSTQTFTNPAGQVMVGSYSVHIR